MARGGQGKGGKGKRSAGGKRVQPVSDEVLLERIKVRHTLASALTTFAWLAGCALVVYASSWPAHEFAGKSTSVGVNLTFGISVTLAGVAASIIAVSKHRHVKQLRTENDSLRARVRKLEAEAAPKPSSPAVRGRT